MESDHGNGRWAWPMLGAVLYFVWLGYATYLNAGLFLLLK